MQKKKKLSVGSWDKAGNHEKTSPTSRRKKQYSQYNCPIHLSIVKKASQPWH
jgi:hypothetical protein